MNAARIFALFLFVSATVGVTIVAPAPLSAMPGWSEPGRSAVPITEEQREHIRNLHDAYRAALANLDWRVDENGHPPDTVAQARDLELALRAEIIEVMHRAGEASAPAPGSVCPYSGKTTPVRLEGDGPTLYL